MRRFLFPAVTALALGAWSGKARAADLIVTDTPALCDVTLSGTLTYDTVTVASGAWICVSPESGVLKITATTITMAGVIYGVAAGPAASDGQGAGDDSDNHEEHGPGGGGHGGNGDVGTTNSDSCNDGENAGGIAYGDENTTVDIDEGSGGGNNPAGDEGGEGGAGVWLEADTLTMSGWIFVSGGDANASAVCEPGGGGSGGGILLEAGTLSCTGYLDAQGGRGGDGECSGNGVESGGGGAGGRIKLAYDAGSTTCSYSVTGGETPGQGGLDCGDGDNGTYWDYYDYDYDGDGHIGSDDCDPADADKWTDAPDGPNDGAECDGIDNDCVGGADNVEDDDDCDDIDDDCDGTADQDGGYTWYFDGDSDGYGEEASSIFQCDSPGDAYAVARSDLEFDCDDDEASVHPDATEACDGVDTDCAGGANYSIDQEDDYDGDGYVPCYTESTAWLGEIVPDGEDCDDYDASIHPGAAEVCDDTDTDDDCDGLINGYDTTGVLALETLYRDGDGDGQGERATSITGCDEVGYVDNDTDCDDDNENVYEGAPEVCDGVRDECSTPGVPSDEVDNDNDGYVECEDDGYTWSAADAIEGYDDCDDGDRYAYSGIARHEGDACVRDFDGDGYGDADVVSPLTAGQDCDDDDALVYPQTYDACDGIDTNCADDDDADHPETAAELGGLSPEEFDYDGDGYVDCNYEASTWEGDPDIDGGDDCDDEEPLVYTGRAEECDGLDNDCDGDTDEDNAVDATYWYFDADLDTYGDATRVDIGCDFSDLGYVSNRTDCDDADASVFPAASEACDGQRNDCDDIALGIPTDEIDLDSDGYVECGWDGTIAWAGDADVIVGEDCAPTDPRTHPDADEICDGLYNDCDFRGGASDAPSDEVDDDADGYVECFDGTELWQGAATEPAVGEDCDDTDPTVFPAATELCDGKVNDCDAEADGIPSSEVDEDDDGYVECTYTGGDWEGDAPFSGADCAPDDATKYPGAPELCDGQFNDCDLEALGGGATSEPEDERDVDGDDYVGCEYDPARAEWADGVTPLEGADCNDFDAEVYPGASELCDGQFNNCDDLTYVEGGAPDDETDDDADRYIECEVYTTVTWAGSADVAWEDGLLDCDDADADTFPGAAADESAEDCMRDADGDDWGDASAEDPVVPGQDCDDANADVHWEAEEVCEATDGEQIDNDCDGGVNTWQGDPINDGSVFLYEDDDGDGFGAELSTPLHVCELADGFSLSATDCDDTSATIHPGAPEFCNDVDEDCDDVLDEPEDLDAEASGCLDLYRDADGDGYGDEDQQACLCLTGTELGTTWSGDAYVREIGDCYDGDAEIRPGFGTTWGIDPEDPEGFVAVEITERLDGHDNDCDGYLPVVELDCDEDGSLPLLTSSTGGSVAAYDVFTRAESVALEPCTSGATREIADCLGEASLTATCDDVTGLWVLRYEESADGFGGRFDGGYRLPVGGSCELAGDCDDTCAARCPGAAEACDGIDNDCTGVTDIADTDGIPAAMETTLPGTVPSGELDVDADGAYDCATSGGAVTGESLHLSARDCDDTIAIADAPVDCDDRCSWRHPDAEERCNGFLDVCDGEAEGTDDDEDGHRTCGAWSGGDLDTEEVFVLVHVAAGTDTADTGVVDAGVTPLLLPRAEATTCDDDLRAALEALVGEAIVAEAMEARSYAPLLAWCAAGADGGSCEVVALTVGEDADEGLHDTFLPAASAAGYVNAACEALPQELVSRTVWHEARVLEARSAVVAWECRRLYGVTCGEVTDATPLLDGWDDPRPDLSATLAASVRWWKEIGRYAPQSVDEGTVMTCWGDPADAAIADSIGGDCDDGAAITNREMAEGPGDLVAAYWDEPTDCSACFDGLDNNCDGAMDCEDPTCAACFAGEGLGCAGDDSPCATTGCAGVGASRAALAGSPLTAAWVAALGLGAALFRRRRKGAA